MISSSVRPLSQRRKTNFGWMASKFLPPWRVEAEVLKHAAEILVFHGDVRVDLDDIGLIFLRQLAGSGDKARRTSRGRQDRRQGPRQA